MNTKRTLIGLCFALLISPARAYGIDTISTFSLDAFSFISFGDREIVLPDSGSTILFRFGTAASDGSIPFSIQPGDVSIEPVLLPSGGGTLVYSIVGPASGTMYPTAEGKRIEFTATVRAELTSPSATGSYDYTMTFTTESTAATNTAGTETLSVAGVRLVDGAWFGQLVGATTNHENAFPEPGAAVYSVLSGTFDVVP